MGPVGRGVPAGWLTVERLRALLPETAAYPVERHVLANLRALNFVVDGILGAGVSASSRFDPQGKALGEWLRSRYADVPEALCDSAGGTPVTAPEVPP